MVSKLPASVHQQGVLELESEEASKAREQVAGKLSSAYEKVDTLKHELAQTRSHHSSKLRKLEAATKEAEETASARQLARDENQRLERRCADLEGELRLQQASEEAAKAQLHELEGNVKQLTQVG